MIMKEEQMKLIADLMSKVISNPDDRTIRKEVRISVGELCEEFPLYDFLV